MRSIRAKSLLIDLLFTAIPLPHRDDARSLIPRCMGYDNQTPGQQAQGDETFFPVSKAVVFEGDARPGKDLLGILEAETVLSEVLLFLRLVPFVFHSRSQSIVALFVVTHKQAGPRTRICLLAFTEIAGGTPPNRIESSLATSMAKSQKLLPPIHPGEILRADFMEPLRLSMNRLALDLRVPVTRIAEIVHERRGITPDTALRLARYFNTSAGFWLNLQSTYDLEVATDRLSRTIEREGRPASFAARTATS